MNIKDEAGENDEVLEFAEPKYNRPFSAHYVSSPMHYDAIFTAVKRCFPGF